ncbi:MAG: DUF6169 family protein [Bacteroidota bacterium]|nr:DUF6169 family protein [Bacteroidota bacterium]
MPETYSVYIIFESANRYEYRFEARNSIIYSIRFERANHLFDELCISCFDVFEVSFAPNTPEKQDFDAKISNTLSLAIFRFVEVMSSAVVFICDSLDNRHQCRHKLFKRWFIRFNDNGRLLFDERTFEFEDFTIQAGLVGQIDDKFFYGYFEKIDSALLNENK